MSDNPVGVARDRWAGEIVTDFFLDSHARCH